VAPPPPGAEGEWRIDREPDGVCALFHDARGRVQGFALAGAAVAKRSALSRQLPAVLP
jgi:rubredoxin-NAD+ reductase